MKRLGAPLLAAVAAMLLLEANTFPASNPPQKTAQLNGARLSQFLGKAIEDPNAQKLGTIQDFVLDTSSARLAYAIVGSGGVLGVGSRTRALPISALSGATILRGVLGTSITKAQWRSYPPFDGNVAALPAPSPNRPAATSPGAPGRLELASKLLGSPVVNRQRQNLGTLSDLIVDLDLQKPALAVIRTRKLLRRPESFAVLLSLLSHTAGNKWLLEVSPQNLEHAPLLSDQAWSAAVNPGAQLIYRVPSSTET
jgi:sporulation protein YlmC with PRC-barrel domain